MDPSIELQKQIRDNAEDVRRFVSDLQNWEKEMKQIESEAQASSRKETTTTPIRNISKKRDSDRSRDVQLSDESKGAKKRISSSDYSAWEKFDVEKACEEIDDPVQSKQDSGKDREIREKRLRDEAYVEKSKGNLFVQSQKWDNAIECYSKAIKCYSRDAVFYCNRALCYLKKKNYRAAETDCTSALALDSSYVKAWHRRGLARKALLQWEEAATDLQQAIQLEPNNTLIVSDFNFVRSQITQLTIDNNTGNISPEVILDIDISKDPDPILPAKKHRIPCCTCKDQKENEPISKEIKEEQRVSSSAWPELENCAVIQPVKLPPHKRSKNPLHRILIKDVGHIAEASTAGAGVLRSSSHAPSQVTLEIKDKLFQGRESSTDENLHKPAQTSIESQKSLLTPGQSKSKPCFALPDSSGASPETLPPVPKSCVQFVAGWKQISQNSLMCYQYLKQIRADDLPKIFQDSLDGNVLSQILRVLTEEFIKAQEPVLNYLKGLTKVRRFRTLTLFLTQSDKKNLALLFKYIEDQENVPSDAVDTLMRDFEL